MLRNQRVNKVASKVDCLGARVDGDFNELLRTAFFLLQPSLFLTFSCLCDINKINSTFSVEYAL